MVQMGNRKNKEKLEDFCRAFQEKDTAAIEEGFNAYLKMTISIHDTNTRKEMKENFYYRNRESRNRHYH